MQRRDFLKLGGAAVTAFSLSDRAFAASPAKITIVIDANDPVASSAPARWAASQLQKALLDKGAAAQLFSSGAGTTALPRDTGTATLFILIAKAGSPLARGFPQPASAMDTPDSVRIAPGHLAGVAAVWIDAHDARGFVYGLLELAERVQFGQDPLAALHLSQPIEEKPANQVRSAMRSFCSEIEDKPWFYDKDQWRGYLDVLAASRFNRFNLALGIGYDFPRGVTDDYLHFPYPYLVDVPGYNVRVVSIGSPQGSQDPTPLSAAERDHNLEMLRFIAAETAARGLQFQLGLWTHAYQWTASPRAYHRVDGLTPETHAAYCRDALAILLKTCPEIQGLTLRVHYESGIPEGSYPFWKTLFAAIAGCGRTIEIDMHAKGVNQTMIDIATATGMPVKLGAKYSAEHQSLGYQQADIRKQEVPAADISAEDVAKMTLAARSFTRYGYADFLRQDSPTELLFRLWPGTQKHLLSCDPAMAAAYGRSAHFCGAAGLELMEPLTFKGREGSGSAGGRCAYLDTSLNPTGGDWRKFEYYYRVWGRHLYNPDAGPETYRRYLRSTFATAATPVETSLASASRVLPLMTSAHLGSASNHELWVELYTNMPIVLGSEPSPYVDTPVPKCFATVSPLDPQLFSTIVEHAADLLADRPNAKYSPVEVAQRIEDLAATSAAALAAARQSVASNSSPEFRRIEEDVLIQIGLGRFFAAKLRSATLFEIFTQANSLQAGHLALTLYKQARDAWAAMADRAARVYLPEIGYGHTPDRRGHWTGRLPAIDTDLAAMQSAVARLDAAKPSSTIADRAVQAAIAKPLRPATSCTHTPPTTFHPGSQLSLTLSLPGARQHASPSVNLLYRHVNQAERWRKIAMVRNGRIFTSAIPAEYTNSVYSLQYYFEVAADGAPSYLHPGFNQTLSNQPYFSISKRDA